MQYPAIWHSSLIFYLLTKFLLPRAAINCRRGADFSKFITCKRGSRGRYFLSRLQNKSMVISSLNCASTHVDYL